MQQIESPRATVGERLAGMQETEVSRLVLINLSCC